MGSVATFDPAFDFGAEAGKHRNGKNRDPDRYSPRLRSYHQLLWSKPLPNGDPFDLDDTMPMPYLRHLSKRGEFLLTSDSAVPTFLNYNYEAMKRIIQPIRESVKAEFFPIASQMGGMMIFPGRRIDGKQTINGARGCNPRIRDRLDLTIECIRLHYLGETSPLADALTRHKDFFALFEDFNGYVNFFLLQDLVSEDRTAVKYFTPFDGFAVSPFPQSVAAYNEYRQNAIRFVESRNLRMADYVARHQQDHKVSPS